MDKEQNVKISFEGWGIDLFITEAGDLGITVEQDCEDEREDAFNGKPCVDIFVEKKTLNVCSG